MVWYEFGTKTDTSFVAAMAMPFVNWKMPRLIDTTALACSLSFKTV